MMAEGGGSGKLKGGAEAPANTPKVLVWGLNDKDQLGGLKGSKIKLPVFSETLALLKPVCIAGGSKSLFVVTADGKVYACGEGTNGRLGLSHCNNVSVPRQITALSQYVVKKVAVHSGKSQKKKTKKRLFPFKKCETFFPRRNRYRY